MKLIVTGTEGFGNYDLLGTKLDRLLSERRGIEEISIYSTGEDAFQALIEDYATERGYAVRQLTNRIEGYATALVAFWDGQSPNAERLITSARSRNLPVRIVRV